jgi:hypothetical protein
VPDCTADPTTVAAPDPCIPPSSRTYVNTTDARSTVVTSSASAWNVGVLAPVEVAVLNKGYAPETAQAGQAQRVTWSFTSTKPHSATDAIGLGANKTALFDSGKTSGTKAPPRLPGRSMRRMAGTLRLPVEDPKRLHREAVALLARPDDQRGHVGIRR